MMNRDVLHDNTTCISCFVDDLKLKANTATWLENSGAPSQSASEINTNHSPEGTSEIIRDSP